MVEQRSTSITVLSSIVGWSYFLCWVATFYPQPILNYRRKRVTGLSIEFVCYQFTGFLCYTVYSIVSYILQSIHESDGNVSVAVRPNDIAFAVHALLLTVVVAVQYRLYSSGGRAVVVSAVHRYILFGLWIIVLFSLVLAVTGSIPYYCIDQAHCPLYRLNLLDVLGYTKIVVNIVKNVPQLLLNHTRHSTIGWSIHGVLLDVAGSTLAFTQQLLDAWNADDGGMVYGNVPKLLLSVLSFVFDAAFLLQHYVCYGATSKGVGLGDEALLDEVEADEDDGGEEASGEDEVQATGQRGDEEEDEQKAGGATSADSTNYYRMQDTGINATRLPT